MNDLKSGLQPKEYLEIFSSSGNNMATYCYVIVFVNSDGTHSFKDGILNFKVIKTAIGYRKFKEKVAIDCVMVPSDFVLLNFFTLE